MERKLKGFKIATWVVSAVAIIAITTLAIILGITAKDKATLANNMENMYQRAYYDLVASVNALEISYSKLNVSSSKGTQIEILNDIAKNSQNAGDALSTLSSNNYAVSNTTKYINQSGDYAISLVNSLSRGGELTDEDYDMLESMYKFTREMGDRLAEINTEIAKGEYNFRERLSVSEDVFQKSFTTLEESVQEYPAMIYDGPFSAALLDKQAKALDGDDITSDEGLNIVKELVKDFKITELKFTGDCKSYFDCFGYEGKTDGDATAYIDISKKGGKLIALNIQRSVEEPKYSPEECAALAEQYLDDLGFSDMKSVWVSNYNSTIYVNLAPVVNDIVWYPDLVKVKIASNDGSLIGVEALSYVYNHTERNISAPEISESSARGSVSPDITIKTSRLALIPYKGGSELLTYEFSGTVGDDVYYVYVDAQSGDEVKILRVIDSDEGTLLM